MTKGTRTELSSRTIEQESQPGTPGAATDEISAPRGRLAAIWNTLGAGIGAALGVLPHVLHHIGLIAGAALVTGTGGNVLFFALGLLLSVPLLRRLHARFGGWRAPAMAIAAFGVMFALSAYVIGPAIAGDPAPANSPTTPSQVPADSHSDHH